MKHKVLEKLLFRRQFVLGPSFVDKFAYWKRININKSLFLTFHPDLEVYQAVGGNKSITLLGYILDPLNPEANNTDIVNNLIPKVRSAKNFFEYTNNFGGRWILIVDDGKRITLFNDAAGLRQVFFSYSSFPKIIWCASQPSIIAELMDFEIDKEASFYMNSSEFKKNAMHWWPGDTSPYKEIKHLIANHFLDLNTGEVRRYWPNNNLKDISLQKAVIRCSQLLQGLVQSGNQRFDLALSVTAGWDSRIILAATRDIANEILFFTSIYWYCTENSQDVIVPSKLLSYLRLQHTVIKNCDTINEDFKKIFKKNVCTAHDIYCDYTQAIYYKYPTNWVCMKGDVSEVAKCFYRLSESDGQEITGKKLASLGHGMFVNSFTTKAFEKWLSNLDSYNIHVLDLFCWEQIVGNFVAMIQAECDIVHESFSPFNCRTLLSTMLSVNEKYRRLPDHQLYKNLIEILWPETLNEPVNPPEKKNLNAAIWEGLINTRLYQLVPRPMKTIGKKFLYFFLQRIRFLTFSRKYSTAISRQRPQK